jgi:hypothetical protein
MNIYCNPAKYLERIKDTPVNKRVAGKNSFYNYDNPDTIYILNGMTMSQKEHEGWLRLIGDKGHKDIITGWK